LTKHKPYTGRLKEQKMPILSLVTSTFKLVHARDQTRSLWIWCKSVQQFPRYFTHKKKSWTAPKSEPYAVHCVW